MPHLSTLLALGTTFPTHELRGTHLDQSLSDEARVQLIGFAHGLDVGVRERAGSGTMPGVLS